MEVVIYGRLQILVVKKFSCVSWHLLWHWDHRYCYFVQEAMLTRDALCQLESCQPLHNCGNKLYNKSTANWSNRVIEHWCRQACNKLCVSNYNTWTVMFCWQHNQLVIAKFSYVQCFGQIFRRKYPDFCRRLNFLTTWTRAGEIKPLGRISLICLSFSIELRLVTDEHRHRAIASNTLAQHRSVKRYQHGEMFVLTGSKKLRSSVTFSDELQSLSLTDYWQHTAIPFTATRLSRSQHAGLVR